MEIKKAPPITPESFLAFASHTLGRKLTDPEFSGIDLLLVSTPVEKIQGYFLDEMVEAQKLKKPFDDYLKEYAKKPLYELISERISADNALTDLESEIDFRFYTESRNNKPGDTDYWAED